MFSCLFDVCLVGWFCLCLYLCAWFGFVGLCLAFRFDFWWVYLVYASCGWFYAWFRLGPVLVVCFCFGCLLCGCGLLSFSAVLRALVWLL